MNEISITARPNTISMTAPAGGSAEIRALITQVRQDMQNYQKQIPTVATFADLPADVGPTFQIYGVASDITNANRPTIYFLINTTKLWLPLQSV
ncbi:hypothetical protein [Spirosoma aerolatum]|uniref:hypothetical protein n=1 Tax=Spirosoma aerolatum TaxID=1211326 RepID=UPI0009ADBBEF|nr:hypothetical protein [Spirosoma aerolatum]